MNSAALEAEYNRRLIPEHHTIMAGWVRDAEAYRQTARTELGFAYSISPRTQIDVFHPAVGADAPSAFHHHGCGLAGEKEIGGSSPGRFSERRARVRANSFADVSAVE